MRSIFDVSGDVGIRVDDILGLEAHAFLVHWVQLGTTRDSGGAYERHFLLLCMLGADGLMTRQELFDPDCSAEALVRFDELVLSPVEGLTPKSTPVRIENDATRLSDRFAAAWAARDWDGIAAIFAADFRLIDRRSYARIELNRNQHLESLRFRFEMPSSRIVSELLATRGSRLALTHGRFELAGDDIGPSESEWLVVEESNGHGLRAVMVAFDADDLDAAYAELDERYAAGEAAPYDYWGLGFSRAVVVRDWKALAAVFAPDFFIEDHRPVGLLTLRSGDEYVASVRALLDLRPDAALRTHHVLALDDRRALRISGWVGGEPEGAFENSTVVVQLYDRDGVRQWHLYNLDQLDEAWAQFEALRPDPLRIPPNAATQAIDRLFAAFAAQDWDAFGALCAPAFVWDDRRRLIRLTGDRDMFIASNRWIAAKAVSTSRMLLATAGDRLALEHVHLVTASDAADAEMEILILMEVNAEGRFIAQVVFDVDDRRAASVELVDRYSRNETGRWAPAASFEFRRAIITHDLARCRALLPDDFMFHDHRRTGAGRLEGAHEYIKWMAALFEQSSDATIETLYEVSTAAHGVLAIGHTFGTLAEGGAFESVFVQLVHWRVDQVVGAELFEVDDLDAARARLEALRDRR